MPHQGFGDKYSSFDRPSSNVGCSYWTALIVVAGIFLVWAAFYFGLFYVAAHFIKKFW
jgi:hypothetical protein